MITSGVLGILSLVAAGLLFSWIAARQGLASACVAISGVPLAALLAVYVFRDRLGLYALAVLAQVIVASLVLVVMGVVVILRAKRERSSGVWPLVCTTILAGTPLVLIALAWAHSSVNGAGTAAMIGVIPRKSVDLRPLVCPCEFDLGHQIDGETILIIDHNGSDQAAFVRIDSTTVRIANSNAFRFQCKQGEEVTASWKGEGATVRVKLRVDGPGEEACSFRGWLTVTKGRRRETRRIIGGCGC